MSESKMRRLVAAGTATAVVLFFVLITFLVVQLVMIGVKKAEADRLRAEIEVLTEENARLESGIDDWLQEWKIAERARQLGMVDGNK